VSDPAVVAEAPAGRAARGVALRQWMGNPLVVAVVSTLLVSLAIPQLTRQWQDHQRALELQTSLVGSMSHSASDAVISGRMLTGGLYSGGEWQRRYNAGLRNWSVDASVVKAKLEGYFPGSSIGADWQNYVFAVTGYLQIAAPVDGRDGRVAGIRQFVGPGGIRWSVLERRDDPRFQDEYVQLGFVLLNRLDALVQDVLSEHPSGF
jgi:hypothetical protein